MASDLLVKPACLFGSVFPSVIHFGMKRWSDSRILKMQESHHHRRPSMTKRSGGDLDLPATTGSPFLRSTFPAGQPAEVGQNAKVEGGGG